MSRETFDTTTADGAPSGPEPAERPAQPSSRALRAVGPVVARDTDATAFTAILEDFLARVAGSYSVAVVDSDGETVDYAGNGDPFGMRIAAAHIRIVLHEVARLVTLGEPRWLVVRGGRKSVAATALTDGYALVVLLRPRAAFTISTRAFSECRRRLAQEAGWDLVTSGVAAERTWFAVEVTTDARGRPSSVGAGRVGVEVLGSVMGLSVRERGYRVRASGGPELTLIREAHGRWYADEPVGACGASSPDNDEEN